MQNTTSLKDMPISHKGDKAKLEEMLNDELEAFYQIADEYVCRLSNGEVWILK